MFAVHRRQDPVGTGLHRQMHERHQCRQIAMGLDQGIVDVAGMAGGITQPRDAGNPGKAMQELAERPALSVRSFAMIGVDVLPDQRELAHAVLGEPLHVIDDFLDRAGDFRAARVRHHAEGAELVAAFLHGDESRDAARADRIRFRLRQEAELVLGRKFGLDRLLSARCAFEQLRQMMIALRADHDVDHGRAADDLLAFGLGDTAGDRDLHVAAA